MTLTITLKQQRVTQTHRITTCESSILCVGALWHHGSNSHSDLFFASPHGNRELYKLCGQTRVLI